MASGYFALEFAEDSMRVGDFETKGDSLVTISAGITPIVHNIFITDTDDVVRVIESSIKKLLNDSKITKKSVNIIIPDSQSYSRIIEMPLLTEKELISAIRYQADQFIPIPIDKANLDVEILHEDKVNKKLRVLLVAAAKTTISRVVSIVEKASLYPESLETQMSSSLRFFEFILTLNASRNAQGATVEKHLLFVNIGLFSTSIYVINTNTFLPEQSHVFALGLDVFTKEIKSNHQIDEAKVRELLETVGFENGSSSVNLSETLSPAFTELTVEISRYITSLKDKLKINPEGIYLYGEGAKIKGLSAKLTASIGITTNVFNVIPYMRPNAVVDYFKADWPVFIPLIGANLRAT
ncbi:hypothetical protein A2690_03660 [Candidatus Roizmanbacteria bacterium RIFCSPHIGHO2_01_FULL_39_12b]|uniref:SHS2 domain-containing protein n=1 Tax=Candidatus Roizmanbacteria bacterium RIFCSPHIGHO2_01_FULL_39_12b TaxID=1802030 RepID=A0A1F7GDC3_9BACT|nr:MAG: hypothetical protein A2690_03660 [Candidatus Roizmanbacteria bacterium RIFCSPHIGHO2_01_FULL_39_12b]